MRLNIKNEFSPLKSVVVTEGTNVPYYEDYKNDDPEFTKFHPFRWDRDLLIEQQKRFIEKLSSYGVEIIIPKQPKHTKWQLYTRDSGFVIGNKLFFSKTRKFHDRNGEIEILLDSLKLGSTQLVELHGDIEGGDILINDKNVYVGCTSRTNNSSISELKESVDIKIFELGEDVMHLDTRMTLLPNNIVLINRDAFSADDLSELEEKYKLIDISKEEAVKLGTNVLIINPETIFVPTQHQRVGDILKSEGFNVEFIDYTEPINFGGSFRCTTMPLCRED